jgi:hypothetical protein
VPKIPFELGSYQKQKKSNQRCEEKIDLTLVPSEKDYALVASPTISISPLVNSSVFEAASKTSCSYQIKTNISANKVSKITEIADCPSGEKSRSIRESFTKKGSQVVYSYQSKIFGEKEDRYECVYSKNGNEQ